MTATCTLCGEVFTAEDRILDAQRDDRTVGLLGGLFRMHMLKKHAHARQAALDASVAQCTIGQLIGLSDDPRVPMALGVVGMTSQGVALYSYLQSADPVFEQKVGQMRQIVSQAMEQKPVKPVVALS